MRDDHGHLYTVAGARFLGGQGAGTLTVGAQADLAAYPADPVSCEPGELPGLTPSRPR